MSAVETEAVESIEAKVAASSNPTNANRRYSLRMLGTRYGLSAQAIRVRCARLWPWYRGHWELNEEMLKELEHDLKEFPPRRKRGL